MQQNAQKAQSGDEKKATKYCNVIHPLLNDSCPKCQRLKNLWCSIVRVAASYWYGVPQHLNQSQIT